MTLISQMKAGKIIVMAAANIFRIDFDIARAYCYNKKHKLQIREGYVQ